MEQNPYIETAEKITKNKADIARWITCNLWMPSV